MHEARTEASHVTYADALFGFSEQRTCALEGGDRGFGVGVPAATNVA